MPKTKGKAKANKFAPVDVTLDQIQDKKIQNRHKRSLKNKAAKLQKKIQVWSRSDLDMAKVLGTKKMTAKQLKTAVTAFQALKSGVPVRPGIHLDGTESDPGTVIKPYLAKQLKSFEQGKLTSHLSGSPVAVCQLAKKAKKSGEDDYVDYVIDQKTGRSEYATGRLEGKHKNRGKGSLPSYLGGQKKGDHKGHGIPEGGVKNPALVNVLPNMVPQQGTTNVSHKKVFENQAIAYAENHPTNEIHTIHERFYKNDEMRPVGETHYMSVDGVIVAVVTIENP